MKGIPVGAESDSDTFEEDSRRGVGQEGAQRLVVLSLSTTEMGPTWAEVHSHSPGAGGAGQKNSHSGMT